MTKTVKRALRYARSIMAEQRREEWESCTVPPHDDAPDAWHAMNDCERKVIRRLDRAIKCIDAALAAMERRHWPAEGQ